MKHRDRYDTNIDTSAGDFKKTGHRHRRSRITINKYSYFRYNK